MRSKVVRTLALALVLGGIGIALGQQPASKEKKPPAKSKLEEMLAEAHMNNPDIRVAAAKLAMAEAELNRTRVEVMQKIVTLHQTILSQKAMVDLEQKKFDRMKELVAQNAIGPNLMDEQLAKLMVAKAKLAEAEAQAPGLLGRAARLESNAEVRADVGTIELQRYLRELSRLQVAEAAKHRATGPLAERVRKALQTPVKVDYKDRNLADVFKDLEKKAPGLYLRPFFPQGQEEIIQVNLRFEEALPVSAILQALEDSHGLRCLVRNYGILVTNQEAAPPSGALTVEEFLRQKPAEK